MENTIVISKERLNVLEEIERNLPKKIEEAILEYKKSNLRRLHEKDKIDPKSVNLRVRRYAEKHREEINAKRREKRKQKKMAALIDSYKVEKKEKENENDKENEKPSDSTISLIPMHNVDMKDTSLINSQNKSITVRVTRVNPPPLPTLQHDVTVRFDR